MLDNTTPYEFYRTIVTRREQNARRRFTFIDKGDKTFAVPLGGDIQEAIERANSVGGGIVLLTEGTYTLTASLTLYSQITLRGAGRSKTIIDFGSASLNISALGTSGSYLTNINLSDFTVLDSGHSTGALVFEYVQFFVIENVSFTSGVIGMKSYGVLDGFVTGCDFSSNSSHGAYTIGDKSSVGAASQRIIYENCTFNGNSGKGYLVDSTPVNVSQNQFHFCYFNSNGSDGFNNSGSGHTVLLACLANTNISNGFNIGGGDNIGHFLYACHAADNFVDAININYASTVVIGCSVSGGGNQAKHIDLSDIPTSDYAVPVIIGNRLRNKDSGERWKDLLNIGNKAVTAFGNVEGSSSRNNKTILNMYNVSGGALTAGTVVVRDASDTTGEQVTTTTAAGDSKVVGIVISGETAASMANTAYGHILTEGFTTDLKVDGTTDIAIGDYLSCFTTAGIAQKASSGHMVFAIALEAYTSNDSNGVIDALIITPRLI